MSLALVTRSLLPAPCCVQPNDRQCRVEGVGLLDLVIILLPMSGALGAR